MTRLRIRKLRFMPAFVGQVLRTTAQLRRSDGFLGGSVLGDRARVFWTLTVWRDEAAMRGYMTSGAHRRAMPRLIDWCDEASVAHWTAPSAPLPDWAEADRRMRAEGRPSKVRNPAPDHHELAFRAPRLTRMIPIAPYSR